MELADQTGISKNDHKTWQMRYKDWRRTKSHSQHSDHYVPAVGECCDDEGGSGSESWQVEEDNESWRIVQENWQKNV